MPSQSWKLKDKVSPRITANVHGQKAVIPELRAELVEIFQCRHTKKVRKIIVAQPGSSGLASRTLRFSSTWPATYAEWMTRASMTRMWRTSKLGCW